MTRRSSRIYSVDPAAPAVPGDLPGPPEGVGQIVVLMADAAAREAGWAGTLAVDLAEAWASAGADVILADGDLGSSALHELVGTPNVEGISDVVRYGASTDRVARPVGGRGFQFIPKGTVVADPEAVYGESRWPGWFDELRSSGIVLVLSLPAGLEGVAPLAEGADGIILLTHDAADVPDDERVVVLRAEPAEGSGSTGAASGSSAVDSASTGSGRVDRGTGGRDLAVATPAAARKKSPEKGGNRLGRILFVAILVVVLVIAVGAWLGWFSIPGLTGSVSTG